MCIYHYLPLFLLIAFFACLISRSQDSSFIFIIRNCDKICVAYIIHHFAKLLNHSIYVLLWLSRPLLLPIFQNKVGFLKSLVGLLSLKHCSVNFLNGLMWSSNGCSYQHRSLGFLLRPQYSQHSPQKLHFPASWFCSISLHTIKNLPPYWRPSYMFLPTSTNRFKRVFQCWHC